MAHIPTLDRRYELDWRSLDYPVTALPELLEPKSYRPRSYTWSLDTYLDQGSEGACVGFCYAHDLIARPQVIQATDADARHIYREAQKIDPWPGEDYEGTSMLAGAKIVTQQGHYSGYTWGITAEDVARAIAYFGPCALGVNWYEGMWNTDADGFIAPTGRISGGHAILAHAVKIRYKPFSWIRWWYRTWRDVDFDRSYVVLHNSWGPYWGVKGRAKLSLTHLQRLLDENGDACFPVRNYG